MCADDSSTSTVAARTYLSSPRRRLGPHTKQRYVSSTDMTNNNKKKKQKKKKKKMKKKKIHAELL